MRKIDKDRIKSGYYRRKREAAYRQNAFVNTVMGFVFIFGGVFNEGTKGGTGFMMFIGILMLWCAYEDSKGEQMKKSSPRSRGMWRETNERRIKAGLEPLGKTSTDP
ncbi:MAG: hypothetical protein ACYSSI_13005, partial [Planctomycetota bacterium]